MPDTLQYRAVRFGDSTVEVREANGATYVKAIEPLAQYATCVGDRLRHWAQVAPERTFIAKRDAGGTWRHLSYAHALSGARALGQALLERDISAKRPLLILSGNDLEHAQLALACQYVGVPYAPISPAYSLVSKDFDKLGHVVRLLNPGMIFAADGVQFGRAIETVIAPDIEVIVAGNPPAGRKVTPFADLLATVPGDEVEAALLATGPDTIAKFLFTSGSANMPKAVINTQRMLCANMQMLLQVWPFLGDEPPVLLDWLPWNHTFGGNKDFNLVLFNGGTLYIDDGKPTPQGIGQTLANLHEVAPTIYFNVPKGWEDVARALTADAALREHFFSRLTLMFYAGASLSQPVWDSLQASAKATCGEQVVMTTGLGMTETAPCSLFVLRPEARAGELGTPAPGLEVKLVPSGDKLELRYRGPNVTPGYWRAPDESAAMFDEEGFFRSGDAVRWLDRSRPELGFVFDGRVAEDFKLNTGTWVSVGPLRGRAIQIGAPYVQDVVLTGHDRADLGMLIFPNMVACRQLSRLPADAPFSAVLEASDVREAFQRLIDCMHASGTGSANRITRALVLVDAPSIDVGEVTDKESINQRAVLKHRSGLVELLYAGTDPAIFKPTNSKLSA